MGYRFRPYSDKVMTAALVNLRAQIIRDELPGLVHVEALLALRGALPNEPVPRKMPDKIKRGKLRAVIKHARYEKDDGHKKIVVGYKFDEAELNRAAINIERELSLPLLPEPEVLDSPPSEAMLTEVMLFLDQANRGPGKEKGRTGDKGVIPEVSPKALPVYFRGSFQSLKDQMIREVNPLTSTFVVDVYVQRIDGEPKGYVVTNVHKAIPGDD